MYARRMRPLKPYVPGEQPRDRRYIKLNTNENPYPPSPRVQEYLEQAEAGDLRLYPDPTSWELREAVAAQHQLDPQQVFIANGSDEALAFIFYAFFDGRRGPILFPNFTYSFYPVYCALYQIEYQQIPLRDDFTINVSDYYYDAIESTGIIFPNPNAPTGIYLQLDAIERLFKNYHPQGIIVIDEAYIAFGGESAVKLLKKYPTLIIVRTFSKSHCLAGARLGYVLAGPNLIDALITVKDSFNSYPINRLSMKIGTLAIADNEYYERINQRIITTREYVIQALKQLDWSVLPSQANFIFARKPGYTGAHIYESLKKQGILVRHFNKEGISDFVRITIGADSDMQQLIARIREL